MRTLRSFLFHMVQHVIYKQGQFRMIYYELGLDGGEPYAAEHPNHIYGFPETKPWPAPRE